VFANIGNNWERTITIYSGGKLINATGWKIGWVIANKKLMTLLNPITFALFISFNYPC
jgi:aspartate/methionine/tyrosine aminotransferase